MENWEFLLQKEGDRAWLPLESADVEILEGRYRVVARSTLHNANVEVRITHQLAEEVPSQWHTQNRSSRTNPEGLMVVIPYTNLKPGIWELCCVANLATESGKFREHKVQLQVLSSTANEVDDIDEPLVSNTEEFTPSNVAETEVKTAISESSTPAIASSQKLVLSQLNRSTEVAKEQQETTSTEDSVATKAKLDKLRSLSSENLAVLTKNSVLDISSLSEFNLQLSLEKPNFVAQMGQPLIIYGQVDISEKSAPDRDTEGDETVAKRLQRAIAKAEVQICLRDPQTSQILVDMRQSLPPQVPPCFFAFTIYLPSDCQTRLILGESMLWDGKELLCTECFTITARLEQLLSVITDNFSEEEHKATTPEIMAKQEEIALNQSFANLSETLKESKTGEFAISSPHQLPPQIATRLTATNSNQSLDLPAFGRAIPKNDSNISPAEVAIAKDLVANLKTNSKDNQSKVVPLFQEKKTQPKLSEIEVSEESNPTEDRGVSANEILTNLELSTEGRSNGDLIMPESQLTEPKIDSKIDSETIETGLLGLKGQDRFLNRLTALANDGELSAWLKASMSPPSETVNLSGEADGNIEEKPAVEGEEFGLKGDRETNLDIPGKTDWKSKEFVVFDDPLPARKLKKEIVVEAIESDRQLLPTQRMPYIIPEDEPVPTPILDVMNKEILAGKLVKIRVRLPELMPRIYVKIWVYDRQSYVILDGPRWLTEFSPNGLGQIEAMGELEIAYGSLDVEFEAIAVEMQTLRESNKVTIYRQVVPPPKPSLPLE
ncbi:hypothetical protein BCD67_08620 [Oscillatoriales cyanobacterium USR001]|nr:hypothetical protein BCD67_08620 [Oscillatoriales cyanobacterium USR001]